MGIEVALEDERGTRIASLQDPTNILHRVLPAHDDPEFHCLNRIDWYGDTTFNRQLLAARAEAEPHLYLKFYGD